MKKRMLIYRLVILSVVSFVGLTVTAANAASSSKSQPSKTTTITDTNQNWDSLIAAAKKEVTVLIYNTAWTSKLRTNLTQAFKAKYGINIEFSPFGRGGELLAKTQSEQRAGLHLVDVFGCGSNTLLTLLKPAGLLGALEPMLVLPEVTDGKNWQTGRVPFVDKDKTFIGMISSLRRNIFYNTDMIKKGEIIDYPDLLKPQYKGKITMNDPTVTGAGSDFMIHLAVNIWDISKAKDYLTQLVGRQQANIQRDNRLQVEEVAKGKYPIGIAPNADHMVVLLNSGAHLDVVYLKRGERVTAAAGAIGVPNKSPHPNATKLFVNWLLSKEGQVVYSKGFGNPSLRKDVPTDGFYQMFLPQPGEKVFPDSEDFLNQTPEVLRMAKNVIDATNK